MSTTTKKFFLPQDHIQDLITVLQQANYKCIGPQVRDGAIVYDELKLAEQLPWGMRDHQEPGRYRLEKIPQQEAFAFANGPQAIKPLLFKPSETVWKVERDHEGKLIFQPQNASEKALAIIGARACDIAAMLIQDKVFIDDKYVDHRYRDRREKLFVVAVNCSYSSKNCFCVSAGTGPCVTQSYDIVMTELEDGFVMNSGSSRGENIISQLNFLQTAHEKKCEAAEQRVAQAAAMQTKRIPLDNKRELMDLLFNNLNHPRWEEVAERCLSCGNCTQVCPTCFCHSEADKPQLDGSGSEHKREWDSCFTAEHSYLNHKVLRDDTRKRYRQWLTHKVGSWFQQFDVSGCVGCGRCVTWCPVGIDITEELSAISGETNIRKTDDE